MSGVYGADLNTSTGGVIPVTQAQIDSPTAEMINDESAIYVLKDPPYTRYFSNGTALVRLVTGTDISNATVTVAALGAANAGNKGQRKFVSDATTPAFNATVVGGGAVMVPVYSNGTNWVCG